VLGQCHPEVILRPEVVVDTGLSDPQDVGQILIAEGAEAPRLDEIRRCIEDFGFAVSHGK
jgi:hypothetical protein